VKEKGEGGRGGEGGGVRDRERTTCGPIFISRQTSVKYFSTSRLDVICPKKQLLAE